MRIKGFLLIEALVAVAVFGMVTISVIPIVTFMFNRSGRSRIEQDASLLLQEGMEVAYNVYSTNFNLDLANGDYKPTLEYVGPSPDDYQWTLSPGVDTELETRFERKVNVASVCRGEDGEIDQSANCSYPSTVDPNSKMITTSVSWQENGVDKSLSAQLLVVNFAVPST